MDYMEYDGMRIRRAAFINEQCLVCGSKVTRLLLGSGLADDNGSVILHTQVVDYCNCPKPVASSTLVPWPCSDLDGLFDRWNISQLKRSEFDEELFATLQRASSQWKVRAS